MAFNVRRCDAADMQRNNLPHIVMSLTRLKRNGGIMFQSHPHAIAIVMAFLAAARRNGEKPVITVIRRD